MQTISVPYETDEEGGATLAALRRAFGSVVRSAYAAAAWWDLEGVDAETGRVRRRNGLPTVPGAWTFREKDDVLTRMKSRFLGERCPLDAWLVKSASEEGVTLRGLRPDGKAVFGTRKLFERRCKGLVTAEEWKAARQRPLCSLGDKSQAGNRHFRLSADARACTVTVYKRPVTLRLPQMHGTWGRLLPMLAALAEAKEINLTFRLDSAKLHVAFDPADLRRLPAATTLQQADDATLAARGHKARGRPRGPNYKPPANPWTEANPRPVHPGWLGSFVAKPRRCLGLDLNPNWVGMTVVENLGDPCSTRDTRVLDHRLVRLDLPPDATDDLVREVLAKVAGLAVALARDWACDLVAMEDGLGKLRSGTRSKALNRQINGWARTVLTNILSRRASLSGLSILPLWGGYSTTVGNTCFALPDACASAAEVGRRGISLRLGCKELLPVPDIEAMAGLWKDRSPPNTAPPCTPSGWVAFHRATKAAKLGVRRPHPGVPQGPPRSDGRGPTVQGHAVSRLGHRRRSGTVHRPLHGTGATGSLSGRSGPAANPI